MRIAYDAKRIFHNRSGLGNYGRNLIEALNEYFPRNEFLLYNPWPGKINFEQAKAQEIRPGIQNKLYAQLWRRSLVSKQAKRDQVDIFHGLSGELPKGLGKRGIASVLTVHDLIFIRYPELYKTIDRKIYKRKAQQAAREAKLIVAISQQTREDLIQLLGVPPEKIKVIGQSCQKVFLEDHHKRFTGLRKKHGLPKQFALFVGSLEARKNPVILAKACLEVDIPLILVGRETAYWREFYHDLSEAEQKMVRRLVIDDNADLAALYQMAELMAYPSIFEGFGIPLLEAMFSKTALITANNSALKEVAGPGSYLVNSINVEELKRALLHFWNSNRREKAIEQNYNFVQQFHPEVIATQWMQTYQDLKAHA